MSPSFVVALIALRVVVVVLLTVGSDSFGIDTTRYHEMGHHEGTHYEDFAVEYLPVALAEIELFKGSTIEATGLRLAIAGLLFDLLTFATLWSVWGPDVANKYLLMVSILLPFAYLVLEPLSICLAVVAFALIHQDRIGAEGSSWRSPRSPSRGRWH